MSTRKSTKPKSKNPLIMEGTASFYTKYNRHNYVSKGEDYTGTESLTIEGEAVPLSQFVAKYTTGEIPPMAQSAFNDIDIDGDLPPYYQSELDVLDNVSALAETLTEEQYNFQNEQVLEEVVQEKNDSDENDQNEKEQNE